MKGHVKGEGGVFIAGEGGNTNDTFLRTGTEANEEAFTYGQQQNLTKLATTDQTQRKGAEMKTQQREEHMKEGLCLRTIVM